MTETRFSWKYIGVWLLAGFLSNMAANILSEFLLSDVRSREDALEAIAIGVPLEAVLVGAIIIAVYSVFASLEMSAVFPWIVGLVGLGVLINLASVASIGSPPIWYYFYQIACTVIMLYGIRRFFKSNGRIE